MPAPDHLGPMFHGTNDEVGPEWTKGDWVHVGTMRAALSRVDPLKWEPDDYPQADELAAGKSRIYQASIRPGASIGPLITDETANRITEGSGPPHAHMYDVHPYSNEYEDPGSTSYVARPSALHRMRPVGRTVDLLRQQPDYPHKELEEHLARMKEQGL